MYSVLVPLMHSREASYSSGEWLTASYASYVLFTTYVVVSIVCMFDASEWKVLYRVLIRMGGEARRGVLGVSWYWGRLD